MKEPPPGCHSVAQVTNGRNGVYVCCRVIIWYFRPLLVLASRRCTLRGGESWRAACSTFGGRQLKPRVGLILPSVQIVTEPLFNAAAGEYVDFVATRLLLQGAGVTHLHSMDNQMPRAVEELQSARVDLIVSCCTASGALMGLQADRALCAEVERSTGIPAISTMLSIVESLNEVEARAITLVTPYLEELHLAEVEYLSTRGFTVLSDASQAIDDGFAISRVSPQEVAQFAENVWHHESDALLLSCMNWRAAEAAPKLGDC
ncbi:hypothetical protein [Arthrobacter sp. B1805]|uniref:aspartate racemase/maleate isomerase family protein n=1 Tax=Arthrobacter sp. B1805 TaxID=2058892 RepID=UPI0034D4A131